MRYVAVKDLVGEEILGQDVLTSDFVMILPSNTVLKPEYIEKLKELEISNVYIKDKEYDEQIFVLKFEAEQYFKGKVKEIIEHHTYRHNEELIQLSEEADNVISSIIQEEDVMDKVYDIRNRSTDIYEHSLNICSLAVLVGLKMGLSKEEIHDIGVGSLLHDIGLRYLNMEYNNQDVAKLSDADLIEYKKHPVYGYAALREENWIGNIAKSIILYHHERLDKTGYPLHASHISRPVQIVAVCDTFDELVCGIGCEKMKVYEAIEYMKIYKNVKLDADIVDIFLQFVAVYPVGTRVLTNEGEICVVLRQNNGFPERPVLRLTEDKTGETITDGTIYDLLKKRHIFIEKAID